MSKDIALDGVDPLHVIEWAMRYFFGLAQTGREAGAPLEEVRKCVREAAQLAGLAAPYRHPRLSAVKHIDNSELLEGVPADATPDELRLILAQRIANLAANGYVVFKALPPPEPVAST